MMPACRINDKCCVRINVRASRRFAQGHCEGVGHVNKGRKNRKNSLSSLI